MLTYITNGFNVRDRQILELKRSGIKNVGISIDGMQKNHDIIRNRTGAFDEAIKAIKLIQENGFLVGVTTTILDINFDDLEDRSVMFPLGKRG